jgi:STE24 endopeptidase
MNESKATRYQRARRRAQAAGLASGGVMLAVLAFTPAGRHLAAWSASLTEWAPAVARGPVTLGVLTLAMVVAWEVASWPAVWVLHRQADRRYAPATGLAEAFRAQLQAALVAAPAAWLAGVVMLAAGWLAGSWWWLLAGAVAGGLLVGAVHATPGLLARSSGARPLDRPALVERLGALARQVRVDIDSIDALPEASTVTASALVAGAGRARRVFIAHELLSDWTDEEIAVVVAHELAHHAHYDLWRTLILDVAVLCAGLWASSVVLPVVGAWPDGGGAVPLEALPGIALVTAGVWLLAVPLRHAASRRQERRADAFALDLTDSAEALQSVIKRLAARHFAEERPSRWARWFYHRHPPVAERLRDAARFQRRG